MKFNRTFIELIIFVILLLAAAIPFEFTERPEPYVFGWLPFPLFYWWILVILNLLFLYWVSSSWLREINEKKR
ncbi:MAG: hypothetical protein L5655_08860 [Thermosediminibacteraceae bacterium]|nr:hypothetical protein [Thermosediminibacteraceae bacterium]